MLVFVSGTTWSLPSLPLCCVADGSVLLSYLELPLPTRHPPGCTQHTVLFVVPSLSHVRLFETSWIAAYQASLSLTISQSLLKLMSIKSMVPSNHLILCRPLLLLLLIFVTSGSFPVSQLFASGGRRYWSFSFSISLSSEY